MYQIVKSLPQNTYRHTPTVYSMYRYVLVRSFIILWNLTQFNRALTIGYNYAIKLVINVFGSRNAFEVPCFCMAIKYQCCTSADCNIYNILKCMSTKHSISEVINLSLLIPVFVNINFSC